MLTRKAESYDVIIIGAGISGLVCASYLAKAGANVLVLEQHDKPGGYCTSFQRKGYVFDSAAHSLGGYGGGKNFRNLITHLGVDKLIEITRLNPSDIIRGPEFECAFCNDTQKTIDNLGNLFPRERTNILRFFEYFKELKSSQFENTRLREKSFDSFLGSFFSDNMLKAMISYPVFGYGGLPPSLMHAFTGVKIFDEFLIDGGYYLTGGIQSLPNAFATVIRNNNGTVLCNKLVKKIIRKQNAVIGVEVEGNESFFSNYVVAACDVSQTFAHFLDQDHTTHPILNKINSFKPSLSTIILYIGLDKPFDGLPKPGTNMWFLPCYDSDKIYTALMEDDFKDFTGGYMLRVSPDRRTILAFYLTSYKSKLFWNQNKKNIAASFLSHIKNYIANLEDHIAYFDAATPHTLYRYTLNSQGANYGWAPLQSQLFEPSFRQKTPIKNLYITGHWTAQTHGIPGVAYLGYNTANLILKSMRSSNAT